MLKHVNAAPAHNKTLFEMDRLMARKRTNCS